MPTARPNITASSGVVEEMVITAVAPTITVMVSATPRMAVISGIPAARSDPRVKNSTTIAITTPRPSTMLKLGTLLLYASPPIEVCDPGMAFWSWTVSSFIASIVATGMDCA